MKRFSLPLLFSVAVATATSADDIIPQRPDFSRYQAMLDRSLFAVATAPSAQASEPDFAKDLYVANAAKSPQGALVTLASTSDRNFKKYLSTQQPVDGYGLASIDWSEKVGETKVTITKDGKYATLTFNQAVLTQPSQNAPGAMQPQIPTPVQPPNPVMGGGVGPNYIKPAPIPTLPGQPVTPQMPAAAQNRARTRGIIQRNPAPVAPTPYIPSPPPAPAEESEE
jgi:hypothetical protein